MKFLFAIRNYWYIRNFELVFEALLQKGNQIEVRVLMKKAGVSDKQAVSLAERYAGFSHSMYPYSDRWRSRSTKRLRRLRSYLRYQEENYRKARPLRARAAAGLPWWALYNPLLRLAIVRKWLSRWLFRKECNLSSLDFVREDIKQSEPDLVVVSPLVDFVSPEIEFLKAAQELELPNCYCVASWDNLTNKGLIPVQPQAMTVWNEAMKREAIELHGMPEDIIHITGAQIWDRWFESEPATTREVFCQARGFDPDKLILLYLCSSPFIAPEEQGFVTKWMDTIRDSKDPRLAEANLLVRPHPLNAAKWKEYSIGKRKRVAVWPVDGEHPIDKASRNNYYDSLYHCAVVSGVNTSALIEAAIVGRSCLTLNTGEFADTQEGTLHFRHLLKDGFLKCSATWDEYLKEVAAVIDDPEAARKRCERFIADFVRPHGREHPCSPQFADILEKMAASKA